MKQFISCLLVLSLSWPTLSLAEEASITPIQSGAVSPITGVVLNPPAIAHIAVELQSRSDQIALEVTRATSLTEAKCTKEKSDQNSLIVYNNTLATTERENNKKTILSLQDQVKSNKTSIPLWIGLGGGTGILLTLVTVFVVSSTIK